METPKPYRIMAFRDFVPDRLRFIILLCFAVIFQFSGGIYLASVSQMVGGKVLLQEDIMMAGYASFIGMTIVFPLLFRFKFRFTSRGILIAVATILILCNVVAMYTDNLLLLVTVCFLAGAFRMIGTFECFSSIQLIITPKRDFTVFFPFIYTLILGAVQLSGITTVYLDYFFDWRYMHILIIALLLSMIIIAFAFMRPFRFMKKLPLYGIDWTGAVLWVLFLLSFVYVLEYGEYLDWLDSFYIRLGILVCLTSLLLAVYRMLTAKRPFISVEVFSYPKFIPGTMLMFLLVIFLATPTVIQNAFTGGILHYDSLNAASLNWLVLLGVVLGTVFSWYSLSVCKWGYTPLLLIGFSCVVGYQIIMYNIIDPRMNIEMLYLPSILRGTGNSMLYVALTLYVTQGIPFHHFFQALSLSGFVRSGFGSVLGVAVLTHAMKYLVKKNTMLLGWELDAGNLLASSLPVEVLYREVQVQAMLVSMKEVFGWTGMIGVGLVLLMGVGVGMKRLRKMKSDGKYMKTR